MDAIRGEETHGSPQLRLQEQCRHDPRHAGVRMTWSANVHRGRWRSSGKVVRRRAILHKPCHARTTDTGRLLMERHQSWDDDAPAEETPRGWGPQRHGPIRSQRASWAIAHHRRGTHPAFVAPLTPMSVNAPARQPVTTGMLGRRRWQQTGSPDACVRASGSTYSHGSVVLTARRS